MLVLSAIINSTSSFLDLREIKINSTEEALQLLRVGLRHRHIAGTRLNYQSSRSHAIFTIKIVRVFKSTRRPRVARVNRFVIHFIYIHVHVVNRCTHVLPSI